MILFWSKRSRALPCLRFSGLLFSLAIFGAEFPKVHVSKDVIDEVSSWTLEQKIGQMLIVGYRSEEQIEDLMPGGVVLFSWSMPNVDATHALTRRLQEKATGILRRPLWIATDHEGGKVLRLRKGLTTFPDALAMGAGRDDFVAFQVGKWMGHELSGLGINMNLAPVMDLGNARTFLGNRVWGEEAAEVARLTNSFSMGLYSASVVPVAKHFPGHGGTTVDSHFATPVVQKTLADLRREDLKPFEYAVRDRIPFVMSAHVEFPRIHRGPASLSKEFLTDLLRRDLGFEGLVITDDLEMGGVSRSMFASTEDAALASLKAGTDLLLVVWSKDLQYRIVERVKKAVERGEVSEAWLNEKVAKLVAHKDVYLPEAIGDFENPFWKDNLQTQEAKKIAREVVQNAVQWTAGESSVVLSRLAMQRSVPWLVVLPSQSSKRVWTGIRPQDTVVVVERRSDDSVVGGALDQVFSAEGLERPVVVVTGPRPSANEQFFSRFLERLSPRLNSMSKSANTSSSAMVWVHQGSVPAQFGVLPPGVPFSMVTLHSSGVSSVDALARELNSARPTTMLRENR